MAARDDGAAQPGGTQDRVRHRTGTRSGRATGCGSAGVEIPGAPRLHGHSDGDAALHAVAGALLGAAALGDLGELYPADERTPRGIASSELRS